MVNREQSTKVLSKYYLLVRINLWKLVPFKILLSLNVQQKELISIPLSNEILIIVSLFQSFVLHKMKAPWFAILLGAAPRTFTEQEPVPFKTLKSDIVGGKFVCLKKKPISEYTELFEKSLPHLGALKKSQFRRKEGKCQNKECMIPDTEINIE